MERNVKLKISFSAAACSSSILSFLRLLDFFVIAVLRVIFYKVIVGKSWLLSILMATLMDLGSIGSTITITITTSNGTSIDSMGYLPAASAPKYNNENGVSINIADAGFHRKF